jgi:hypothetical protein
MVWLHFARARPSPSRSLLARISKPVATNQGELKRLSVHHRLQAMLRQGLRRRVAMRRVSAHWTICRLSYWKE